DRNSAPGPPAASGRVLGQETEDDRVDFRRLFQDGDVPRARDQVELGARDGLVHDLSVEPGLEDVELGRGDACGNLDPAQVRGDVKTLAALEQADGGGQVEPGVALLGKGDPVGPVDEELF